MRKSLIILVALAGVVFMACGGGGDKKMSEDIRFVTMPDGQRIPQGGTLIVGLISDVKALNPYISTTVQASNIESLIFMTLADINKDLLTYSPRLAKSWEFSEDRKTLTFHLRNDVYWADGEKTTAKDVVFSHEVAVDPRVAWSAIRWKDYITDVTAVDDTTVVFTFDRVYPYQMMDATVGPIIPEHLLGDIKPENLATAEYNLDPIGNGPYKLKSWRQQQQIELEANPDYYEEGKPHLDRIVYRIVPDRTALLTQLKTGEIDMLENVPMKEFQQLKKNFKAGKTDIKPYEFMGRTYDYVAWNTIDPEKYDPDVHTTVESFDQIPNPFFADAKIRRAMTHAIDRELIREAIGYGLLVEMRGPIAPILWAYDESLPRIEYDPEQARQLLSDAGWIDSNGDGIRDKDGRKFQFIMKTNTGNERREQACTLIQDMLSKVGVKMEIRMEEGVTFFDNLDQKQFEAALAGWSVGLKVDMTTTFHSRSVLDKFNFPSYRNPEFDRINDQAKFEMDRERAKELWSKAQRILIEDQPYTWLFYTKSGHGLHKRFKDVIMDQRGTYVNVRDWWVPADERKY
ncbi:MAG: peptide-binding protein [Candidatus Marinimicrobia bacterium]|nr:peptide-binding protein [Candidatus Neomarinimicrobiota bacterium]MCF7880587.1 peptide-binding protein [Candidatus Neomarinimicrobiota bacterium]